MGCRQADEIVCRIVESHIAIYLGDLSLLYYNIPSEALSTQRVCLQEFSIITPKSTLNVATRLHCGTLHS
jgi:hypothetical protein